MIEEFSKLVFAAQDVHAREMVDPLMGLQLGKPVEMTLTSAVHPVNIKVIVVGVLVKAVGDVGSAITGGAIKDDLAIDGGEHVPARQKEVELVFGNLPDYRVPGLEDIHDKFALPNFRLAILVLLSFLFALGLRSDAIRVLLQLRMLFTRDTPFFRIRLLLLLLLKCLLLLVAFLEIRINFILLPFRLRTRVHALILFHALGPEGSLVKLLIGGVEHVGVGADTVYKKTITIAIIAIETISSARVDPRFVTIFRMLFRMKTLIVVQHRVVSFVVAIETHVYLKSLQLFAPFLHFFLQLFTRRRGLL